VVFPVFTEDFPSASFDVYPPYASGERIRRCLEHLPRDSYDSLRRLELHRSVLFLTFSHSTLHTASLSVACVSENFQLSPDYTEICLRNSANLPSRLSWARNAKTPKPFRFSLVLDTLADTKSFRRLQEAWEEGSAGLLTVECFATQRHTPMRTLTRRTSMHTQ
jgi:hypothetical protein